MTKEARYKKAILWFFLLVFGVGIISCIAIFGRRTTKPVPEAPAAEQTAAPVQTPLPTHRAVEIIPVPDPTGVPEDYVFPGDQTPPPDYDGIWAPSTALEEEPMPTTDLSLYGAENTAHTGNDRMYADCVYDNSGTYSCELRPGVTLHVGLGSALAFDGIVLDLHTEDNSNPKDESYCYVIITSRGELQYAGTPAQAEDESNAGHSDFFVCFYTYDRLVPARYQDPENYGLRWLNNISSDANPEAGCDLRIYVMRHSDGEIMGVAELEIAYDKETTREYMAGLTNENLRLSGEINDTELTEMVDASLSWMERKLGVSVPEGLLQNQWDDIVVDRCGRPIQGRFYNTEYMLASAGEFLGVDMIALHIPHSGYGTLTFYFAPYNDVLGKAVGEPGERPFILSTTYTLLGRSLVCPFTIDTFKQYLNPGDIRFFRMY